MPPTPDLIHALGQQLRLVETMAWEPAADVRDVHAEVHEAYHLHGLASLHVMAATAGHRLRRLARVQNTGIDHSRLPRDLVHATATTDDAELVDDCLRLIDQQASGQVTDLSAQLVGSGRGEQALIELLSIAMTLAQQVADRSPGIAEPRKLVAQEAVRSEQIWLQRRLG